MAPSSPPAGPSGELPYDRLLAFETILAASPLNVTIYDRDFIVREASVAAAELAGVSRAALVGRCLRDDLPADRLAAMDLAQQYGEKMHLGVFYRNPEPPPTYGDLVKERQTMLSKDALPKERILDLFIKK